MYYFELFPPPCVRPALCVYEGRHYSLGETWMDNACMQCTCLHPVGVGCCETWVHKQTVWFGVQMPTVSKPHGLKRLSDFVFMVEQQFHQMFCLRIKKVATNVVSLQESCLCVFFYWYYSSVNHRWLRLTLQILWNILGNALEAKYGHI